MISHSAQQLRRLSTAVGAVGALFFLLSGCSITQNTLVETNAVPLVKNAPFEVRISHPKSLSAGQTGKIEVTVLEDGKPQAADDNDHLLHVIISSADMLDLSHTFEAVRTPDGRYHVDHRFTQAGTYRVWVELDNVLSSERHGKNADFIGSIDLQVSGTSAGTDRRVKTADAPVLNSSFILKLSGHQNLRAGKAAQLTTDVYTKGGKPVSFASADINATVADPVAYVVTGDTLQFFRHGHPSHPEEGEGHSAVDITFDVPGDYLFWIQYLVFANDEPLFFEVPFALTVK